jgi:ribonuclease Z
LKTDFYYRQWHNALGRVVAGYAKRPIMSSRELIVLGTSSLVPTRERSHNAYLLRWDGEGFLFDPGEGTQRQLTFAGIAASSIHHICITHFHGDHCLGLPGILQRLSVDQCSHPVHLYYPESGRDYLERLRTSAIYQSRMELHLHPVRQPEGAMLGLYCAGRCTLSSFSLEHSVPTIGYRLEESESMRFLPEKLEAFGVRGPMVGELQRRGSVQIDGQNVHIEDVAVARPGCAFAFVMDTRFCSGAVALAKDADLVLMEATYTSEQQELADLYFHSTAADAAKVARAAGAHRLALSHFSQRYGDTDQHILDAQPIFPNVVALRDMDRIDIPRRSTEY